MAVRNLDLEFRRRVESGIPVVPTTSLFSPRGHDQIVERMRNEARGYDPDDTVPPSIGAVILYFGTFANDKTELQPWSLNPDYLTDADKAGLSSPHGLVTKEFKEVAPLQDGFPPDYFASAQDDVWMGYSWGHANSADQTLLVRVAHPQDFGQDHLEATRVATGTDGVLADHTIWVTRPVFEDGADLSVKYVIREGHIMAKPAGLELPRMATFDDAFEVPLVADDRLMAAVTS